MIEVMNVILGLDDEFKDTRLVITSTHKSDKIHLELDGKTITVSLYDLLNAAQNANNKGL